MWNHVVSFAGGVWGAADALRTCMGWEPGPAHCSTNNSVIHSQGLSLIYPWPWHTDGRLPSLPIQWVICPEQLPFKPNPSQNTFMFLKAFENHGVPIFYTKCYAQWWKIFCREFIHNYSFLTEIKMYSVLFWLSKYCCCTRKNNSLSSRGFSPQTQALPTTLYSAWSKLNLTFVSSS